MKTLKSTKKEVCLKKLEKLADAKKVMRSSLTYSDVKECILSLGKEEIRPVFTRGSGRYISVEDHTQNVIYLLQDLGLNYNVSNDAPRAGKCGTRIDILTKIK